MFDLTGMPALDVAIGLAFLYFLLSTVCAAFNEAIANVLGWRAKTLEDALRNLLDDPKVDRKLREWVGFVGAEKEPVAEPQGEKSSVPAALTPAVLDHWRVKALVRNPRSLLRRRRLPSYLPPRAFSLAVAETLAKGAPATTDKPVAGRSDQEILEALNKTLEGLPAGNLRDVLQKAAANAHNTLEGFRKQLETAFDDGMQRASGWYKRKAQVVILVFATVLTLGLNVDSARIADRLWSDDTLRATVVGKAVDASERKQDTKAAAQQAADAIDDVKQLGLPIGWEKTPSKWDDVDHRIGGWAITILALMLGAPFWFDLLNKFVNLRGSGAQPKAKPKPATG